MDTQRGRQTMIILQASSQARSTRDKYFHCTRRTKVLVPVNLFFIMRANPCPQVRGPTYITHHWTTLPQLKESKCSKRASAPFMDPEGQWVILIYTKKRGSENYFSCSIPRNLPLRAMPLNGILLPKN